MTLLLAIEETSLTQFAVLQWHYTSSELCVVHAWLYNYKHCVKRVARLRNMVIEIQTVYISTGNYECLFYNYLQKRLNKLDALHVVEMLHARWLLPLGCSKA